VFIMRYVAIFGRFSAGSCAGEAVDPEIRAGSIWALRCCGKSHNDRACLDL
jgi:hypothetical protein